MKHMVAWLCEIVGVALVVLFCIGTIFYGTGEHSIFQMAGQVADAYEEQERNSQNHIRLQELMEMPSPEVRIEQTVFETGERINLSRILQVRKDKEQQWQKMEEIDGIKSVVLRIAEKKGKILMESGKAQKYVGQSENVDWFYFEPDTMELSFGKSGSYVLKIKVTDDYGRYAVKDVIFLIEAGLEEV